jgi:hypothetical protein
MELASALAHVRVALSTLDAHGAASVKSMLATWYSAAARSASMMIASLIRPTACAWYSALTACSACVPGDPGPATRRAGVGVHYVHGKRRRGLVLVASARELSYQVPAAPRGPAEPPQGRPEQPVFTRKLPMNCQMAT